MTFKGAVRWGLRPKRIAVLVAKLLLAGTTDLAAQTMSQEANQGVLHDAIPFVRAVPTGPADAVLTTQSVLGK